MKLRIHELAKQRGMTLQDIARLLGINRVNLSNSLNGNPTLSRLEDVAKVLGVEVADLFERKERHIVQGYLEYNDKVVKIDSLAGIRCTLMEIDEDCDSIRLERDTIRRLIVMKKAYEDVYNKEFTWDSFLEQMSASVEEGDIAVWEEYCRCCN